MKALKLLSLLIISTLTLLLASCAAIGGNSAEEDAILAAEIGAACEDMDMQIRITQVIPKGGPHIRPFYGDYIVRIQDGTIDAYLPYIGESYSAIPGDDYGVWFQRATYTISHKTYDQKRGMYTFVLKARSNDFEDCELTFRIYDTGSVSIDLFCTTLTNISYNGTYLENSNYQVTVKSSVTAPLN